jgi:alkanesulfonate monooxygenase SsuD/methylene tetrahydromethanopterin reductase-like flavin-dependent oxidoreductase (luciferase family)
MLAKTTATFDVVSGGRFELGLSGGRMGFPQISGLGRSDLTPGCLRDV